MTQANESPTTSAVIVGLGYVGLPLLLGTLRGEIAATGLDLSSRVVDGLNTSRSHVDDVSDGEVAAALDQGASFTTDPSCIATADYVIICVPTPLSDDMTPDLSAVQGASRMVSEHIRAGCTVVLESTTYPGTTDGVVRDILQESGLVAGNDFHLAFSPERIDPGNQTYGIHNTPKVVGGLTPACTGRAVAFYSSFIDEVVPVSGPREAEMSKLLENTYRHVNIALVNEMAVFSHDLGIDLWESIRAAETKPFGFAAFWPGPGVGGHCIPIDPNYLSYQVRSLGYQFRFVELAQEISNRMPNYVARRVQDLLNRKGLSVSRAEIAVLGLTYKANISDDRETPSRPLISLLSSMGAKLVLVDPHIAEFDVDGTAHCVESDMAAALRTCDVAILLQAHDAFDLAEIVGLSAAVFDTRGVLVGENVERL